MSDRIKVKEAAELLDVTEQTVYGMIRSGRLHKYQPTGARGRIYVYRSEVLDILRQSGENPAPNPFPIISADMIMTEVERNRAEKAESPNSNRRTGRIEVYFSDEDYTMIERLAAIEGIAKSEFVRRAVQRDIALMNLLDDYLGASSRKEGLL